MATTPQPRSYADCLADIVDAFLSKTGLRALKAGSGILSAFEAAAQSDLRCTEDVFTLLDSDGLDNSEGSALVRIGVDENVPKQVQTPAQGVVSIIDASFAKVATKVFQGKPAPLAGSLAVYVADASGFPTVPGTYNLYIGRGTQNLEGPLAFTAAPVNQGGYWSIALTSGTQRFHNVGETVVLAQGGLRTVMAGTQVQTATGNAVSSVQFRTLYPAYLQDGEVEVDGVPVVALKPGQAGNVPNGAINSWVSGPPFGNATVTNPSAISNGIPSESDTTYRERIRLARRSRSRGTPLAVTTAAVGVTAPDEAKTVLTAAVVARGPVTPATLYIDDGTGYEEAALGVSIESFVDDAVGGEDRFRVARRPVAKAYLVSSLVAPFQLQAGAQLAFTIGGLTTVHTLSAGQYQSINSATAQELVDAVGGDPGLQWVMRTYNNGTQVAVQARQDTNESIQYSPIAAPNVDANQWLGFPLNKVDTLKLFRNDLLLSKDGAPAVVTSSPFTTWPALGPTEDLQLQVDGTQLSNLVGGTYTFTALDFINANTGFATVGKNTVLAWAQVLQYRIPGITAQVVNGAVVVTSNRGLSKSAQLSVLGGSLATKGVFALTTAQGANQDYVLDRNTGELQLSTPLSSLDKLAAGSSYTRAFVASPPLGSITMASTGRLWWVFDGGAQVISTTLTAATSLTYSNTVKAAWAGVRQRVTAAAGTFANVQAGDWAIWWDAGAPAPLPSNRYRVAAVAPYSAVVPIAGLVRTGGATVTATTAGNHGFTTGDSVTMTSGGETNFPAGTFTITVTGATTFTYPQGGSNVSSLSQQVFFDTTAQGSWFEFDLNTAVANGTSTLPAGGLTFARTAGQVTRTSYLANTYAAQSLSGNTADQSGTLEVYRTTTLRVRTNTRTAPGGDVMLVAANPDGQRLGLPVGTLVSNLVGQIASMESGNLESGTPDFHEVAVTSASGPGDPTIYWSIDALGRTPDVSYRTMPLRPLQDGTTLASTRWGTSTGSTGGLLTVGPLGGGNTYPVTQKTGPSLWFTQDRLYLASPFRFAPEDQLSVLVDGNTDTQRYSVPMARNCTPQGAYGSTLTLLDADNAGLSLAVGFGTSAAPTDFSDFAVMMQARLQTHLQGDNTHYSVTPPDTSKTVLWRYYRAGQDGNQARVRYGLPAAALAPVGIVTDTSSNQWTNLTVQLAGGAARAGYSLLGNQKIGTVVTASASGISNVSYLLGLATSSATRAANVTTITVSFTASGATDHNFQTGDQLYVRNSNATYPDGAYTITRVSATQFSYADVGANAGPTAITGSASYGTAEATLTGGGVVVGDLLRIDAISSLGANFVGVTMRADTLPDNQTIKGVLDVTLGVSGVVQWANINSAQAFHLFANATQSATAIVAAVNALPAAGIRGTVIGTGAGTIDKASYAEAASDANQWFQLQDGINYVSASTAPASTAGQYTFALKNGTTAALATNNDWANEKVKLVPTTALNAATWFQSLAVSGLSSVCEIAQTSQGHKVQLSSLTAGSLGSLQFQGGTANAAHASVQGAVTADVANLTLNALVRTSDIPGFIGGAWCSIDNQIPNPKSVFGSTTNLTSVTALNSTDFRFVFNAGGLPIWTETGTGGDHIVLAFERQGRFIAIRDTGFGSVHATLTSIAEGCWIRIAAPPTSGQVAGTPGFEALQLVNGANTGIFRVVRSVTTDHFGNGGTIWIENPAAVDQPLAEVTVHCYTADSMMPGDQVRISTSNWDVAGQGSNKGLYTVIDVGNTGSGSWASAFACTLRGPGVAGAPTTGTLGTQSSLVQCIEGQPARYIKQLLAVAPNDSDATLSVMKFASTAGVGRIGAASGSIVTPLDKFAFPTQLVQGIDGYRYSTGLLAEVNRVEYGNPQDPLTYPGVVAAGAHINLEGSRVKRIQVSLSIRTQTGVALQDLKAKVQGAVSAYINALPAGISVSLSGIEAAVQKVAGVVSVVLINPAPSVGLDLIAIQPYQKPRILNADQDILVTFLGQ